MMRDSITVDSTRLQRLQQIPLWDFAGALYAKPGVEAACLILQEQAGIDVCELLFHCWLYSEGLEARSPALESEREQRDLWQRRITGVLRGLRCDLKPSAASNEAVAVLRETIKQAELMAERENLQRWQTWVWEADEGSERVDNIAQNSVDAANWLRSKLVFKKHALPMDAGDQHHVRVSQALQTLTYQLDPHWRAR